MAAEQKVCQRHGKQQHHDGGGDGHHDHGDDGGTQNGGDPAFFAERTEPGDEVHQAGVGAESGYRLDDEERRRRGEECAGYGLAELPGHKHRSGHGGDGSDGRADQVQRTASRHLGQGSLPPAISRCMGR